MKVADDLGRSHKRPRSPSSDVMHSLGKLKSLRMSNKHNFQEREDLEYIEPASVHICASTLSSSCISTSSCASSIANSNCMTNRVRNGCQNSSINHDTAKIVDPKPTWRISGCSASNMNSLLQSLHFERMDRQTKKQSNMIESPFTRNPRSSFSFAAPVNSPCPVPDVLRMQWTSKSEQGQHDVKNLPFEVEDMFQAQNPSLFSPSFETSQPLSGTRHKPQSGSFVLHTSEDRCTAGHSSRSARDQYLASVRRHLFDTRSQRHAVGTPECSANVSTPASCPLESERHATFSPLRESSRVNQEIASTGRRRETVPKLPNRIRVAKRRLDHTFQRPSEESTHITGSSVGRSSPSPSSTGAVNSLVDAFGQSMQTRAKRPRHAKSDESRP